MSRSLLAVVTVTAGLIALGTACQVVETAPMAHTEDIPIKQQSVAGLLYGAHATIACEACHVDQPAPYAAVDGNCLGCHNADRRQLHPLGKDHEADAKSCGGSGCHSVAHQKWSDWALGTQPTPTDTNDTGPIEPTNCWIEGPVTNGDTCANICHGETNGYNPAPDDASHRAHTVLEDAQLWNLVDSSSLSTDNCSVCHPAGGQGAPTHDNCEVDVVMQGVPAWSTETWPSHVLAAAATTGTTGTTTTTDTGAATTAVPGPGPVGLPAYDPATQTCANVYCHGAGFFEGKPDPVWGDPQFGQCGSCHGAPPVYNVIGADEHPDDATCTDLCHGPTAPDGANIAAKPVHIDGEFMLYGTGYPQ